MAKARLVIKMIKEYELVPDYYPEGINTPEQMVQFDIDNIGAWLYDDVDLGIISPDVEYEIIDDK